MVIDKRKIIVLISWAAVLIWMLLIFNLSSQAASESDQLSTGITEIIVKVIEKIIPKADFNIEDFNHIVRKNAHFIAYLVLGVLVINALKMSGIRGIRAFGLTLGICMLYAVSDEIHQLFVPGRSGEIRDVMIDSSGAAVGIVGYMLTKMRVPWH